MTNIYVGNLDLGVTQEQIFALFAVHGAVESATLVLNRDTGQARGFGFVVMTNEEEAAKAIQALQGTLLNGRPLTVNEAREKPQGDPASDLPADSRDHRRHRY
ncbi:MAG: RNA recognition motif domain-containing protein [Candidatus Korobacteraceae bacterium]